MTKKPKHAKKGTKNSKRITVAAQPEDETDTAIQSEVAEAPQATTSISEADIAVESHQPQASPVSAAPATPSSSATRSEAAKANIREGIRLHKLAGSPSKAQIVSLLGLAGHLLTWPKRTERFGITPETFQAELAKGVQMKPLVPKTEETKT